MGKYAALGPFRVLTALGIAAYFKLRNRSLAVAALYGRLCLQQLQSRDRKKL